MEVGTAIMENSIQVPQKLKLKIWEYDTRVPLLDIYLKEIESLYQGGIYTLIFWPLAKFYLVLCCIYVYICICIDTHVFIYLYKYKCVGHIPI
jgi:hypothetical protein